MATQVPLVRGEIGESDCADTYINPLMSWLDSHGASSLGWAWETANCSSFPALISNYNGTPAAFGAGFQSYLAALAGAAPPPATATPTAGSSPTVTVTAV